MFNRVEQGRFDSSTDTTSGFLPLVAALIETGAGYSLSAERLAAGVRRAPDHTASSTSRGCANNGGRHLPAQGHAGACPGQPHDERCQPLRNGSTEVYFARATRSPYCSRGPRTQDLAPFAWTHSMTTSCTSITPPDLNSASRNATRTGDSLPDRVGRFGYGIGMGPAGGAGGLTTTSGALAETISGSAGRPKGPPQPNATPATTVKQSARTMDVPLRMMVPPPWWVLRDASQPIGPDHRASRRGRGRGADHSDSHSDARPPPGVSS